MAIDNSLPELKMDAASLYREDIYTDRKAGTIRVLTPVKSDGSADGGRKVLYIGEAQLLTPVGTIPLAFPIEADSLGKAVEGFAAAAKVAVERAIRELQELRREASSSILIPEGMPGGMGGPGGIGGVGGLPGGGRIKMP